MWFQFLQIRSQHVFEEPNENSGFRIKDRDPKTSVNHIIIIPHLGGALPAPFPCTKHCVGVDRNMASSLPLIKEKAPENT